MKANEFRIGNFVIVKGKQDILTGIAENDYISKLHGHGLEDDDIEVITLTDDWLDKFGFEKNSGEIWCDLHSEFEHCSIFSKKNLDLYYDYDSNNWRDRTLNDDFGLEFKYVHQLQNTYFALTGEELKTK